MNIQFHLTNACNLRCKHCYQNEYDNSVISLYDFEKILSDTWQYFDNRNNCTFLLALTGGEPFVIDDFYKYVEIADKYFVKIRILSNGTLLTKEKINQLQNVTNKIEHIQFSLEGPKEVNDQIRGEGSYDQIMNAINICGQENMSCVVSYTLSSYNYNRVKELYYALNQNTYTPKWLWFDRCIPFKEATTLTTEQFSVFINDLQEIKADWLKNSLPVAPRTIRALQFFSNTDQKSHIYSCLAGIDHFTIMHNGDVMICRRLNVPVGNLLNESWGTIRKRIKPELQRLHKIPDDCMECKLANPCRGGLKCLTYSIYNDYNHKDINCLLNNNE